MSRARRLRWWITGAAAAVLLLATLGGDLSRPHLKPVPGIPAYLADSQPEIPDTPPGYQRYLYLYTPSDYRHLSSEFSAVVPNYFVVHAYEDARQVEFEDEPGPASDCLLILRQSRKNVVHPMRQLRVDHVRENSHMPVHEIPHGHGTGHYRGARAASWTYSYTLDGIPYHEYDLEFNASRFYTIELSCPPSQWKYAQTILVNVLRTFQPTNSPR